MSDITEAATQAPTPTSEVRYAVQTTTIDFFDRNADDNRGKYLTATELRQRMADGKNVNRHCLMGKQVDTLEDAKILLRAAELGQTGSYVDPYADEEQGTRITNRKIVKIEEIA